MEKLIVLGTGNASVTKCYNTCSIIQDKKGRYFMIDAGGGNGILTQLEKMNIPVTEIHDIFGNDLDDSCDWSGNSKGKI